MGYTAVAWLVQTISREEGVGADAVGWRAADMFQVDVEMIHRID